MWSRTSLKEMVTPHPLTLIKYILTHTPQLLTILHIPLGRVVWLYMQKRDGCQHSFRALWLTHLLGEVLLPWFLHTVNNVDTFTHSGICCTWSSDARRFCSFYKCSKNLFCITVCQDVSVYIGFIYVLYLAHTLSCFCDEWACECDYKCSCRFPFPLHLHPTS